MKTEEPADFDIHYCTLCPRECGADRTHAVGRCGGGAEVRAARAALHPWEEPCLTGKNGAGTVFFSGCSLGCIYCQNAKISNENWGKEIPVSRLADIFLELQEQGAACLDLVSGSHYVPWIVRALERARNRLEIPVVFNCGGYEKVETLRQMEGLVDIYLPDFKYWNGELAARYSDAADYPQRARAAILEMFRQTGPAAWRKEGLLKRGLMVRHLVLPGARMDSASILQWLAEALPTEQFLLSLMSQYTPYEKLPYPCLNRRVSTFEYQFVLGEARRLGLQGYMQERSSAKEEYTPDFSLQGI